MRGNEVRIQSMALDTSRSCHIGSAGDWYNLPHWYQCRDYRQSYRSSIDRDRCGPFPWNPWASLRLTPWWTELVAPCWVPPVLTKSKWSSDSWSWVGFSSIVSSELLVTINTSLYTCTNTHAHKCYYVMLSHNYYFVGDVSHAFLIHTHPGAGIVNHPVHKEFCHIHPVRRVLSCSLHNLIHSSLKLCQFGNALNYAQEEFCLVDVF